MMSILPANVSLPRRLRPTPAVVATAAALLLATTAPTHGSRPAAGGTGAVPWAGTPPAACPAEPWLTGPARAAPSAGPKRVELTATARARGARGAMTLWMGESPYGVAVAPDGSYRLRIEVAVEGLRSREGVHHVVWAATPELDRHVRLGTLAPDGRVAGELAWNKFLVFVTAETTPEPDRWSQEILLSALSPSGRMHTMAGHGPFSGEPCLDPRS